MRKEMVPLTYLRIRYQIENDQPLGLGEIEKLD